MYRLQLPLSLYHKYCVKIWVWFMLNVSVDITIICLNHSFRAEITQMSANKY